MYAQEHVSLVDQSIRTQSANWSIFNEDELCLFQKETLKALVIIV